MSNNGTGPSGTPISNLFSNRDNKPGYQGNITGPLTEYLNRNLNPFHHSFWNDPGPNPLQRPSPSSSTPKASGAVTHGGGTQYSTLPDGRQIYRVNGVAYDRKSGQQVFQDDKTKKAYTHDEGFSLEEKDGGLRAVPHSEQNLSTGTGGGETRVSPTGVIQKGTNMSRVPGLEALSGLAGVEIANFAGPSFPTQTATNKINANYPATSNQSLEQVDLGDGNMYSANGNGRIIEGPDAKGAGNFDSAQLPSTTGNPFTGNPAQTPAFNAAAPGVTGAKYDNYGADGGVAAASDTDSAKGPKFTGKEAKIEGASQRPQQGLADALADTSGMNVLTDEGSREARRRSAFLDAPDSLSGLRRVEAGLGYAVAGGKAYANVNGTPTEIGMDVAREIKNAAPERAQGLKDAWVANLTSANSQAQPPASTQDPVVKTETPESQPAAKVQKQVKSSFGNVASGATDFLLNNMNNR